MRVSLQIDGDASGAVKAATDASRAVTDLGKQSEAASDKMAEGFEKAQGAAGQIKGMSEAAGAANDNVAATITNITQRVADLANKTLGSESALAKASAAAGNFAAGLGAVVRTAGPLGLLSGSISLATTAASIFFEFVSQRSAATSKLLEDNAKHVDTVRDAFRNAAGSAGEFYRQSAAVSQLLLTLDSISLQSALQKQVGSVISNSTTFANIGDWLKQIKQVKAEFAPFEDQIFKLQAGFKAGTPDVKGFMDEVARIGNANPAAQQAAGELIKLAGDASKTAYQLGATKTGLDAIKGTASDAQKKMYGFSTATQSAGPNFERFLKSVDRQSASLEAEAAASGGTAGAIAKLRTETILTEAAHQAGAGTAAKYADQVAAVAARAGDAAQKLALTRLQSDNAFQLSQLGRNSIDQTVAGQLQGVFGDNFDLNGSTGQLLRFTETMKDLKSTTLDFSQGAWHTFLAGIQQGQSIFKSLGDAGVDALNRIIAKLGDKVLDDFVSNLFRGVTSSSGLGKLFSGASSLFAAAGGGTFGPGWGVVGEKGPEIIRVFGGGVTVYPHEVSKPYLPGFAEGGTLSALGTVTRLTRQDNSSAGWSNDIQVSVTNNGTPKDVQARQSVDGRGQRRVELVMDDQQAAAISRSGSATQRALVNSFGARQIGVKR